MNTRANEIISSKRIGNRGSLFFFLLITFLGCIEPFDVSYDINTSDIVITGIITDKEPARVQVTKPAPSPFTANINIAKVSGALVTLLDNLGNVDSLSEVSEGVYLGKVKGVVGRNYHIRVMLPDEQIIESIPQLLKPCPSIDNLTIEQVSESKSVGSQTIAVSGLNLNLYMNRDDTVSGFYKWKTKGTYKIYSAYDFFKEEPPCYVTLEDDLSVVLGESIANDADLIVQNIRFLVPNSTFAEGQSIEVSQYSMTESAYDYWRKIDEQQKNIGSIFDPPPTQIVGNLFHQTNQEAVVMGFFEVSSVKKKRIFVDRLDFPSFTVSTDLGINSRCFAPPGWLGPWVAPSYCEDCVLIPNSTKIKPPYWPQ
jgi:hypothetical protein